MECLVSFSSPLDSQVRYAKRSGLSAVVSFTQKSEVLRAHEPCSARVAVLMCTYNGQRFLAEQLDSIGRQLHCDWIVAVSDDDSQDATLNTLQNYRERWGDEKLSVWPGPGRGFAANFLALTCNRQIEADFYAWADQDDVWYEDKLQAALAWLQTVPKDIPALYCGRTELISEDGRLIGRSPLFCRPPAFVNALVQNVGGGNTMVFNQAARKLLQEAGESLDIVSHDWWAYLLVTGVGGRVFYDPRPFVRYRQHDANFVGANSSWSARMVRLRMVFQGRFSRWSEQNIAGLETVRHRLCEENRVALAHFKTARDQGLLGRLISLRRSGVYRQTLLGNLGLILAALLKGI